MSSLSEQLAALASMPPPMLRSEWRRVYKKQPPQLTPDLLARGIAWRLQEKVLGGLSAAAKRELARRALGSGVYDATTDMIMKPGTRMVRSWRGVTYAVLATPDGYLFNDKTYRSLSAIAEEITGTRWSGPRFFGLKQRAKRTGGKVDA